MRILVIGGTSLISTAIVAELFARGDGVTVFNRGNRPPPPASTNRTAASSRSTGTR
jgi:uncharacterized protein YbjT (DUF2867 family)